MTQGVQDFSLNLLQKLSKWKERNRNTSYILATYSMWSLLIMLYEAAEGETFNQLRETLGITVNDGSHSYHNLYYDQKYSVFPKYWSVVLEFESGPRKIDFEQKYSSISRDIQHATDDYIQQKYERRNLIGARMLLVSAIYFRGKWKFPFNKKLTKVEPFYSEEDPDKEIAKMPMMVQTGKFAYVDDVKGLDARVLELPYGKNAGIVMLALLPKNGSKVTKLVDNVKNLGLEPIRNALKRRTTADMEVEVKIPKFDTYSQYLMPKILSEVGLEDVVNSDKANLGRMTKDRPNNVRMSLSNCNHFARIVVDERGTPGAVPNPARDNKTAVVEFHLTKPFLYIIVRNWNLILYAGVLRNAE